MKKILLILTVLVFVVPALAQKEMLTKEETVNYLNKKAQEADGGYKLWSGHSSKDIYSGLSLTLDGEYVLAKYKSRSDGYTTWNHRDCRFNPANIKGWFVDKRRESDTVAIFSVRFSGKTVKCAQYESYLDSPHVTAQRSEMEDFVWFPFLDADPSNRTKIEKAFKHLSDLAKAEDDPFGN